MSEKERFEYWKECDIAYDTKRRYGQYFHIIDKKECVDLLNELSKENEQLKERISELNFLLELAKLHTEVAEGKTDKFVELKLND